MDVCSRLSQLRDALEAPLQPHIGIAFGDLTVLLAPRRVDGRLLSVGSVLARAEALSAAAAENLVAMEVLPIATGAKALAYHCGNEEAKVRSELLE